MMFSFLGEKILYGKRGLKEKIDHFHKTEFYGFDEIQSYQNKKLRRLIDHAYQNVPYYRKLFEANSLTPNDINSTEDLALLPVLEKKDIREKYDDLIAKNISFDYARATSGSTGRPLKFLFNNENKIIELALVSRFNKQIGNTLTSNRLLLWNSHAKSLRAKLKLKLKEKLYSYKLIDTNNLNDEILDKLISKIVNGKYDNLRGYANAIHLLAKNMKKNDVKFNFNSISVTSEKLHDYARKDIVEVMGSNLFNQYGCGEVNSLAFECSQHNGMHHAFEHSVLEILDDNNKAQKSGNVVITNLDNYAMPLIRYKNGDLATLSNEKCSCERRSKLIESIDGRSYDFLIGLNGAKVHGGKFNDVIFKYAFSGNSYINEYKIVQTKIDELLVQYTANDILEENVRMKIEENYKELLGSINIHFEKVEKINATKSGKRKFVISLDEYEKYNN